VLQYENYCRSVLGFPFWVRAQGPAAKVSKNPEAKPVTLPNGWTLSPAGRSIPLEIFLLISLFPVSKKWIGCYLTMAKAYKVYSLLIRQQKKVLDNVVVPKSWYGLKFSADEKHLYASGGNDNCILQVFFKKQ
jgi:hypothetical protein